MKMKSKSNGVKTKILIIHHIPSYSDRIKAMVVSLEKDTDADICIVAFNDAKDELEKESISCKSPDEYLAKEDYARWEQKAVDFVKSLGHKKFTGDKTLIKLLEYRSTSLWWFIEANFYRYHMKQVIRFMESLCGIIDKETPSRIVVINDGSVLVKTATAVSKAKNISIQFLTPGLCRRLKIIARAFLKIAMSGVGFCFRGVRDPLRSRLWRLEATGLSIEEGGRICRKIFLASMGRESVVRDSATGKKMLEDSVLGSLVRELEKDEANEIVFLYKSPINPFRLRMPEEAYGGRSFRKPWEYYLTPMVRRIISAETKVLRKKWSLLKSDHSFIKLFIFRGINLWDVCGDELELAFWEALPNVVKYIELSKEIIETEKPDVMVIASENSIDNKALILAGNLKNIPVLAVQHGVVTDDYSVYFRVSAEELEVCPSRSLLFPDRLAIFGEGTRNTLVREIGYPFEDRIIITGQSSYDVLIKAGEIFNRERFCAKWGIKPNKKIVLVASQTFTVAGNPEVFHKSIIQALKNISQVQIVIKPHPADAKNEEWFARIAQEMKAKVVVLPKNSNTKEALYACDVLIAFYSTVVLEAMILGKPVVTVNLTGSPDPIPYASSGSALGVYKFVDIAPAVREALENQETRNRLEQSRKKYLYKQFYKLDGQATIRVIKLIYDMMVTTPSGVVRFKPDAEQLNNMEVK